MSSATRPSFFEQNFMDQPTIDEQRTAQQQRFVNQIEPAPVSQADLSRAMDALERGLRGIPVGQQLRMTRNH